LRGEKTKILIAAGGTGGHVFPAISIAEEIKKLNPRAEILFVGTKSRIEARIVPQRGYAFTTIWISGLQSGFNVGNILFPVKLIVSIAQSFALIKKFAPDVVVGTGGYVCGPVLFVAIAMKIPSVIHESNSYPGVTTRLISKRANLVFTSFDVTIKWLRRKDNVEYVGTPTRDSLEVVTREEGSRYFNLDPAKKTVFVFGGSLGARSINESISNILTELIDYNVQLIWQTGSVGKLFVDKFKQQKDIWVGEFIDRIEYAYALADVVVCRAGATTIAEITRLGKAAILIPYPYAKEDHQTYNAKTLAEAGAAIMIPNSEVQMRLKAEIFQLLKDDEKRNRLSEACKKFGKPDAGEKIAKRILAMVN